MSSVGQYREGELRVPLLLQLRIQAMCDDTPSIDRPMSCVLSAANSPSRFAKPTISVLHTGVKSAGWLNSTTHLPASVRELSCSGPSVEICSKSGASLPMIGSGRAAVAVSVMKGTSREISGCRPAGCRAGADKLPVVNRGEKEYAPAAGGVNRRRGVRNCRRARRVDEISRITDPTNRARDAAMIGELRPHIFVAAAMGASLLAASAAADSLTVAAGKTLTLDADRVLSGDDVLEVLGTAEAPCTIVGNGFRIRSEGNWKGRVKLAHAVIKGLGSEKQDALRLSVGGNGDITIENCTFDACGSVTINNADASAARFRNNIVLANSMVPVTNLPRESPPAFFTAGGASKARKLFQGNRVAQVGRAVREHRATG